MDLTSTPIVTTMRVVPIAGHDSMLLNLSGAHGPFFTRNLVIMEDASGHVGVGEVPGGEAIRRTLSDAAPLVLGEPIGSHARILARVLERFGDLDAGGRGVQTFDQRTAIHVVTAIEVIEHHPDPIAMLREIRALLKPGGLLLLSTGNAGPWRKRLLNWSYAQAPDVHIGFFDPASLAWAFRRAGLKSFEPGFGPGSTEVIRYKVLKALGIRVDAAIWHWLPWGLIARAVDRVYRQSRMPWALRSR